MREGEGGLGMQAAALVCQSHHRPAYADCGYYRYSLGPDCWMNGSKLGPFIGDADSADDKRIIRTLNRMNLKFVLEDRFYNDAQHACYRSVGRSFSSSVSPSVYLSVNQLAGRSGVC